MPLENFLSFLQQLLAMVDPKNKASVELAKISLRTVISLAETSQKVGMATLRLMHLAEAQFDFLVMHREDYIGVPGEYSENHMKRKRLEHVLTPGC